MYKREQFLPLFSGLVWLSVTMVYSVGVVNGVFHLLDWEVFQFSAAVLYFTLAVKSSTAIVI